MVLISIEAGGCLDLVTLLAQSWQLQGPVGLGVALVGDVTVKYVQELSEVGSNLSF